MLLNGATYAAILAALPLGAVSELVTVTEYPSFCSAIYTAGSSSATLIISNSATSSLGATLISTSTSIGSMTVPSASPTPSYSPDGLCGSGTGFNCYGAPDGSCCSQYGYCGGNSVDNREVVCGTGCQAEYGDCDTPSVASSSVVPASSSSVPSSVSSEPISTPTPLTDDTVNAGTPFAIEIQPAGYNARKRQASSGTFLDADGYTTTDRDQAVFYRIVDGALVATSGGSVTANSNDTSVPFATSTILGSIRTEFSSQNLTLGWNNAAFHNGTAELVYVPASNNRQRVIAYLQGAREDSWIPVSFAVQPTAAFVSSSSTSAATVSKSAISSMYFPSVSLSSSNGITWTATPSASPVTTLSTYSGPASSVAPGGPGLTISTISSPAATITPSYSFLPISSSSLDSSLAMSLSASSAWSSISSAASSLQSSVSSMASSASSSASAASVASSASSAVTAVSSSSSVSSSASSASSSISSSASSASSSISSSSSASQALVSSATASSSVTSAPASSSSASSSATSSSSTASSATTGYLVLPSPTACDFGDPPDWPEDDSYCRIDLPEPMVMYASSNTATFPASNGYVSLGQGSQAYEAEKLPSTHVPAGTAAPYWDDLAVFGAQTPREGIFYQLFDDGVTYEWYLSRAGVGEEVYHFTVEYKYATPGVFEYAYYETGPYDGQYASVGIQGNSANGTLVGFQFAFETTDIVPGLTVTCDTTNNVCTSNGATKRMRK